MTEAAPDGDEAARAAWSRLSELMLEESRRAIDGQREVHESLRGRAGNLLTYGGAVAALFVSFTPNQNWATWLALGAFAVLAIFCVLVLSPITLNVDMSPVKMYDGYVGRAESVDNLLDGLARAHWVNFLHNSDKLEELHIFFTAAAMVFLVEIGLFVTASVIG